MFMLVLHPKVSQISLPFPFKVMPVAPAKRHIHIKRIPCIGLGGQLTIVPPTSEKLPTITLLSLFKVTVFPDETSKTFPYASPPIISMFLHLKVLDRVKVPTPPPVTKELVVVPFTAGDVMFESWLAIMALCFTVPWL